MKPVIVPAILTADPAEAREKLDQLAGASEWVQIDVCDGKFVSSTTIQAADFAPLVLKQKLEVHLMVDRPEHAMLEWEHVVAARRMILPVESLNRPALVFSRARAAGVAVELGLNPDTPVERVEPYLNNVDGILFLSVHPGKQGQPLDRSVLEKISAFRAKHPGIKTAIDGGVNETNIADVAKTGVDRIVVGSALYEHGDPKAALDRLRALVAH